MCVCGGRGGRGEGEGGGGRGGRGGEEQVRHQLYQSLICFLHIRAHVLHFISLFSMSIYLFFLSVYDVYVRLTYVLRKKAV